MNYELTLIPADHFAATGVYCVHCNSKLEIIDQFISTAELPMKHEGVLYACSYCGSSHLELLNGSAEFDTPVVIGWN